MFFDDIVVGSGLAGLGTVLGLPSNRKVLVIGGPSKGFFQYYDGTNSIPAEYLGHGGLGNFWHGVIPTTSEADLSDIPTDKFIELFNLFYPKLDIDHRLGGRWLFVPYLPIRAAREWRRMDEARKGSLIHVKGLAHRFEETGNEVHVISGTERYIGRRLWLAAGTLRTPDLLQTSIDCRQIGRRTVSDHVIAYLGLIDRRAHSHLDFPRMKRTVRGVWVESYADALSGSLYTLKPARFSYRGLDHGIEQRAAFGLPTRGVIAKVAQSASLGLVAEGLYNKFGLFPKSSITSVYAQVRVPDAYDFQCSGSGVTPNVQKISQAIANAARNVPWKNEMIPSARRDLFIKGIHLHHSLNVETLKECGINLPGSRIQIVDASAIGDIGCEHHSFKLMARAYAKAQLS